MRFLKGSWIILCLILAAGMSGCSTSQQAESAGRYFEVTAEQTPFYKTGPGQAGAPDLTLNRGRVVKMVKRGFGFSLVELESGAQGWIATSDIGLTNSDFSGTTGDNATLSLRDFDRGAIVERYYVDDEGNMQALPTEEFGLPTAPPAPDFDAVPQEVPLESLPQNGTSSGRE
jgi:hypothetical protein